MKPSTNQPIGAKGEWRVTKRSMHPEWEKVSKKLAKGPAFNGGRGGFNARVQKGMGPNKASGHKGGMGRQGSKRG